MNTYINSRKSRILVVDDDEMLNCLFCSFLDDKGFEPIPAFGVAEAKQILQSDGELDLMLLDYQLGDGLGMHLLEHTSVITYKKFVPVVMISANEDPDFLEECFTFGVNDYIIKPVNLSLLALKVDALLKSINMQAVIAAQNAVLEKFKNEAVREEQIAKFTYEYLLRRYSPACDGIDIWLKSFAAFSGDMALTCRAPSGSLFFMLADATGHGLSAAITIMPVLSIFNDMVSRGFHLQQIVAEINRKLVNDTPDDRFVAASVIEINPLRQHINVWNGGMPGVYWVDEGRVVHDFKSSHMALGILDSDMFDAAIETISLPESGFLLTFTDGLTEQENSMQLPFGSRRVLDIVANQPEYLLQELAGALTRYAGSDAYDDDVSICILNPQLIFAGINCPLNTSGGDVALHLSPFSLELKLTGKQLQDCEIPPLCNHFLQKIGCSKSFCQKIFSIVSEMVSNAIDHGILKLSSALKESDDGFSLYFLERESRMKNLSEKDFVVLRLLWGSDDAKNRLIIDVEDSGGGYCFTAGVEEKSETLSGRGNSLIKRLSESIEVFPPGNKIRAIVK